MTDLITEAPGQPIGRVGPEPHRRHRGLRRRRAAHAVPVREARRRPAAAGCAQHGHVEIVEPGLHLPRGRAGRLLLRPAVRHGRAVPPGRRGRRRDQPDRASAASTPAPGRPTSATGCRRPTPASFRAITPSPVLRAQRRRLRAADARLVPDGRTPAGRPVHRQPEPAARDQRAGAAARARFAVGRPDPRAEQPGRGRGPGHVDAARTGRRHAAQAGPDRRRHLRPAGAGDADQAAGGGRRARREGADRSARWRPPTARTS